MIVLGLHTGHDGSAAVVKDGRLVASLSRERLSRNRKQFGVEEQLITYVLDTAGVSEKQIDCLALSDFSSEYAFGTFQVFDKAGNHIDNTWNRIWGNDVWQFDSIFRSRKLPAYNVAHHTAHCAAAFYTSPFEEAECISMDASGGELQSNFLHATGRGTNLIAHDGPWCVAGMAYGGFCEWLGVGPQMFKCGSLMALAGYSAPTDRAKRNLKQYVETSMYREGAPHYRSWMEWLWDELIRETGFCNHASDSAQAQQVAANIQYVFEEAIAHFADTIKTQSPNVCLGGGSFLNCSANSRLFKHSKYENLHLFPAATDDGLAAGAALYVAHHMFGQPRAGYKASDLAYLGKDRPHRPIPYEQIAEAIANGKIVAWSHGKSECGPRALGNRSILADPRKPENRDRINGEIKRREWYRPLAPSVIAEKAPDWFEEPVISPYMLFTAKHKRMDEIPACGHVDGTARHQTVTKEDNPEFYRLLQCFEDKTGVPILLNTSLNGQGEPICETHEDAMAFFQNHGVDLLVSDGEVYER